MQQVKSFQEVDLAAITASNEAWWKGELGRPIFHCVVHPPAPALSGNGYAPRNFLPLYPRQMPVQQIFKGVIPYLAVDVLILVLMIIFPGIATFIPNMMA